ncbi:uncharacterized protein LOC141845425 [Curcuma longa]|uniref:uncharacterized protein LOC141845425 n=1 Tax=Curcuma longa TaxID=136217 RepID=UPI003D9E4CD6
MDLDYALKHDRPTPLSSTSTTERVDFDKRERSNHIGLSIMRLSIPKSIKGSISEDINVNTFLNDITNRFISNEKVETSMILSKFVSMWYKGKGSIKEYIMEMSNIVIRLKALKLEMYKGMLVHFILISLPAQFTPFKINYNTQKEKWALNEFIAQCVQEEETLKLETFESAQYGNNFSE